MSTTGLKETTFQEYLQPHEQKEILTILGDEIELVEFTNPCDGVTLEGHYNREELEKIVECLKLIERGHATYSSSSSHA